MAFSITIVMEVACFIRVKPGRVTGKIDSKLRVLRSEDAAEMKRPTSSELHGLSKIERQQQGRL